MNTKSKKVTMDMIALAAGTSRNTVFKVLRNKPGVADDMRTNVLGKAKELGYIQLYNVRKQRRFTILVKRELFLDQSYFSKIFLGIESMARKNDCQASFTIIDPQIEFKLPFYINASEIDGIIVAGKMDPYVIKQIANTKIPVVFIDHYDRSIAADTVIMSNESGMREIVTYLVQNGHQKIGFIGNVEMYTSFNKRFEIFLSEMRQHDLDVNGAYVFTQGAIPFWDIKYLKIIFDGINNLPTALVCANDRTAIAIAKYFSESGVSIPIQLSITGFDNVEESVLCVPSLTTANVHKEELGGQAVEMLLWRLNNPNRPFRHLEIEVELKVRKSVKNINPLKE